MGEVQLDLLAYKPSIPNIHAKGETYNPVFDCERLGEQQRRVLDAMRDGEWRSLREIASITDDPEASISARLRAFNGDDYLSRFWRMESERVPGHERRGHWRYRLLARGP